MASHVFYPSPELPDQVLAYADGLKHHKSEFGDVVGNAPADLKSAVAEANQLKPQADEIEALQIQLAAKLDAYHKAAAPLWKEFSERLGYARNYAAKKDNAALKAFLLAYRHNEGRHAAKAAATPPAPPPATPPTPTT
jgi:hypothetical protein